MAQDTAINGNRYSFTSISAESATTGASIPIPEGVLQSINWTATKDPGIVQGNRTVMQGRTRGYGVATGDFELLLSEFDDWSLTMTSGGTFALMDVFFDWHIGYSENNDADVRVATLRGCLITSVESPNAKGNDAAVKRCQMSIARVTENGVEMFADAK